MQQELQGDTPMRLLVGITLAAVGATPATSVMEQITLPPDHPERDWRIVDYTIIQHPRLPIFVCRPYKANTGG
jgi:hypothetical protein